MPAAPNVTAAAQNVAVPLPPCRLLDTRTMNAPAASPQVTVAETHCRHLVPPNALTYSLRVTSFDWKSPQQGTGPAVVNLVTVAVPADGRLTFTRPVNGNVAVDLVGYHVPPGTPRPADASAIGGASESPAPAAASSAIPRRSPSGVATNDVVPGAAGEVRFDAQPYWWAGVFIKATAASPWIGAQTLTADANSGLIVYNSNANSQGSAGELMRLTGNGGLQMPPGGYFSGRTDFQGFHNSAVPYNVVNSVRLVNPRDGGGGATQRVHLFNAATDDEAGSPPSTKYVASTGGFYNQANINYDSQYHHHNPAQYHFRAYSRAESKDTFSIKPAADVDAITGTRADMYVSGNVSIGSTTPVSKLHVVAWDATNNTVNDRNAYGGLTVTNGANTTAVLRSLGSGHMQLTTDATGRFLSFGTGAFSERMRISADGNIGIGTAAPAAMLDVNGSARVVGNLAVNGNLAPASLNVTGNIVAGGSITGATVIGATYQDLAEWVPADADLAAGTVVVLNRERTNEVTASTRAYDSAVAGVVSAQPGIILGVGGEGKEQVATTGRVKVKVDASRGAIAIGDILVSSDRPGMAMKSQPIDVGGVAIHRPGTVIGKALEPLPDGQGEILVLLSLQ